MTTAYEHVFTKGTAPSNPAAGQMAMFYNQTVPSPQLLDESGNVITLGNFSVKDYRYVKTSYVQQGTTTYTPGATTTRIKAYGIGAGAAGGSSASGAASGGAGGGGGSGALSIVELTVTPSVGIACVVGAGGTPGTAGNNPGGNGADTTLGAGPSLTAKGGTGGSGSAASTLAINDGGAGGVSSSGVGDLKFDGNGGAAGLVLSALIDLGGAGGVGPWGGGAIGKNTQGNGNAGLNYGAGGSGGVSVNNGGTAQGGAGGNGVLIIEEYAG